MRHHDDRGVALLEMALVLPLLLLLAFGTAEMGLAWTASNRVEGATSTAARVGATVGRDSSADIQILDALRAALPEESLRNLDRVIVFLPTNNDGGIPGGCIKAVNDSSQTGVSGQCNTYTGATVRGFDADAADPLGTADNAWNGSVREDSLVDNPPQDLGVWVRTVHEAKTGTFWGDRTITRTSIYRIQPDIDG